ncbi:hypothetical protein FRC16_006739 [Serendipita sp. 398]|nr:hypothetical protein FRC16_006739 [Serendipita sp. 398]
MALTFDLVVDRQTARDALRALLHSIFFHRLFGVVKPTTIDCLDVTVPAVKDAETEALVDETVDRFLRALNAATNTSATTTPTNPPTHAASTAANVATTTISTATHAMATVGATTGAAMAALARGGVPAFIGGGGGNNAVAATTPTTAGAGNGNGNGNGNGKKDGEIEVHFAEKKQKKATWFNSGGEAKIPWETWTIKVTLDQPQSTQDREILQDALATSLSKAVMAMVDYTVSERGRGAIPVISTATGISPFPIHTVLRVKGQVVP